MKKKVYGIIMISILAVALLSGCTSPPIKEETFTHVKIDRVEREERLFDGLIYTVYFTNGMKKEQVYDSNILFLRKDCYLDITFYRKYSPDGWGIKSFNYVE